MGYQRIFNERREEKRETFGVFFWKQRRWRDVEDLKKKKITLKHLLKGMYEEF